MAKVLSLHEVKLQPGVSDEDLERFYREEASKQAMPLGLKQSLLKCDRGPNTGKYYILIEIESLEERARLFPAPDTPSEEFLTWQQQRSKADRALDEKEATIRDTSFRNWNDYVVVSE